MKARHPEEFHRRLEVEDNRKRKGYEDAELVIFAEAEVDLLSDIRYINKVLAALRIIERTSEQIRLMLKRARYKELGQELKRTREHANENLMEELSSAPQPSLCNTLKSYMKEGDDKYLEFFECASRGHAQRWPQSLVEELDQVLRQSYPFLKVRSFGDTVRKNGRSKLKDWPDPQLNGWQRKQVSYRTTQEMWRTDRRGLAKVLLEDGVINPRPPAIGHFERVYKERFSEKAIDSLSMTTKAKVNIKKGSEIRLLELIRPNEVGAAIKDQKAHCAGGAGGISVKDLRRRNFGFGSDLFLLADSWVDTSVDEAMPDYPDSKDKGSDGGGGKLETDYHWFPFDPPLHNDHSSAVEGRGRAESAIEGVQRGRRLC